LGVAYRKLGRHEEAIATLKRALIHKPDLLAAHANLLIAYGESGHEAEARAEAVEILRLSPQFSLEVWRQRLPYKDQAELERFLDGLRKAGLK
jgi:adenylate cyclase